MQICIWLIILVLDPDMYSTASAVLSCLSVLAVLASLPVQVELFRFILCLSDLIYSSVMIIF